MAGSNQLWIEGKLSFESIEFSTAFIGQYVNRNITGRIVTSPIHLTQGGFLVDGNSLVPRISLPRYGQNHITELRELDRTEHSLIGLNSAETGTVLSSVIDYSSIQAPMGNRQIDSARQMTGIYPVTLIFDEDQFAVGFKAVQLFRNDQIPYVSRPAFSEPRFRVKFFRRDGALISEVILTPDHDKFVAFARCGGAADIAGIQITNTTKSGLAFDDFMFGVPHAEPSTPSNDGTLSQPDKTRPPDNPLQVDLCSFYTS